MSICCHLLSGVYWLVESITYHEISMRYRVRSRQSVIPSSLFSESLWPVAEVKPKIKTITARHHVLDKACASSSTVYTSGWILPLHQDGSEDDLGSTIWKIVSDHGGMVNGIQLAPYSVSSTSAAFEYISSIFPPYLPGRSECGAWMEDLDQDQTSICKIAWLFRECVFFHVFSLLHFLRSLSCSLTQGTQSY